MKRFSSIIFFKKLFNSEDSYLTLFWYWIINILIAVIQEINEVLILLFVSLIIITISKKLQEKYQKNVFNVFQDIFLLIISCLIVIMQNYYLDYARQNTSNEFEIIIMIYEEFLTLNILHFKVTQGVSLIFYFSINLMWVHFLPVEIAYLILMKITMFFMIPNKKNKKKKKLFPAIKEEFIFNHNCEKTFVINNKRQFHLIDNDEKKNVNQCIDSPIQKLEIVIIGEYPELISLSEFKKCLLESKKKDPSIKLQDFIEKINLKNAKTSNSFFIAEGRFFSQTENNLILIYKMKEDKFIIKVRRDILYDEISRLLQTNSNYSRAISFVAHEFRTPLNCIVSMLQTLDQQIDPKLSNNFIMPAIISSKFLLNMVSDLLDIAQIEAEKFKLVTIDFDLKFLMQDTLQIVVFQAMKRGIDLKMNFDNNIKRIKSDPNRIRQIIINLLSNFRLF